MNKHIPSCDGSLDKIVADTFHFHPAKSRMHTAMLVIELNRKYRVSPQTMRDYIKYAFENNGASALLPDWCEQNNIKHTVRRRYDGQS